MLLTGRMVAVCPQIAQIGLIGIFFADLIGISCDLRTFGIRRAFSGRTDPKVWFGCTADNLMHYSGL